jgi:UDP-3-O-[3-hydroxymyristoyl] glucosamine N-acyltransferase
VGNQSTHEIIFYGVFIMVDHVTQSQEYTAALVRGFLTSFKGVKAAGGVTPRPPVGVIVHESATVGKDVVMGDNVIIGAGTIVGARARIGDNAIIASGVVIGAGAVVEPYEIVRDDLPGEPPLKEVAGAA